MNTFKSSLRALLLLISLFSIHTVLAQADPALIGRWRINESLSDDTDDKVEKAMEKSGAKLKKKWFDSRKDKYRGGPAEQEIYDRFSYDSVLTITARGENYLFEYADGYKTMLYTDDRSHAVSLNALEASEDFLMGQWEPGKLQVEMHPRDGGYVYATYSLIDSNKKDGSKRLQALFTIKPGSFTEEIKLERVYDRIP